MGKMKRISEAEYYEIWHSSRRDLEGDFENVLEFEELKDCDCESLREKVGEGSVPLTVPDKLYTCGICGTMYNDKTDCI